jgi:hypothetical protein
MDVDLLRDQVRQRLKSDPLWQYTVRSKWICPYCGTLVHAQKSTKARDALFNLLADFGVEADADDMRDEVVAHLTEKCPTYNGGAGRPMSPAKMEQLRKAYEVRALLKSDKAWRVVNKDRRWIDPFTGRLTDVVIGDDDMPDRANFKKLIAYLNSRPEYQEEQWRPRSRTFLEAKRRFLDDPDWRVVNAEGYWISPYDMSVTSIEVSWRDEEEVWDAIWKYLVNSPAFQGGSAALLPMARIEALAAAVAGRIRTDADWQTVQATGTWQCPYTHEFVAGLPQSFDDRGASRTAGRVIARHLLVNVPQFRALAADVPDEELGDLLDRLPDSSSSAIPVEPLPAHLEPAMALPVAPAEESEEFNTGVLSADGVPLPVSDGTTSVYSSDLIPGDTGKLPAQPIPAAGGDQRMPAQGERDRVFHAAARKQRRMLPPAPTGLDNVQVAVRYEPCEMIGGDFYDFILVNGGDRLVLVQGDVAGHGLETWGDMASAMKTLRAYSKSMTSAREILIAANEDLVPDLQGDKTFVTVAMALLDLTTLRLLNARAGHNATILHNPAREPDLVEIQPNGMVVGLAGGDRFASALTEEEVQLQSGDVLAWTTDGLTETHSPDREEYGPERLNDAIRRLADRSAEEIIDGIWSELHAFRGGADVPTEDDMTICIMKVV